LRAAGRRDQSGLVQEEEAVRSVERQFSRDSRAVTNRARMPRRDHRSNATTNARRHEEGQRRLLPWRLG
jgi:hypothetical protein